MAFDRVHRHATREDKAAAAAAGAVSRNGWLWCSREIIASGSGTQRSQRCDGSLRGPLSTVPRNNEARPRERPYVVCGAREVTALIMGHSRLK